MLDKLSELKSICKSKMAQATKLKREIDTAIIERDLALFVAEKGLPEGLEIRHNHEDMLEIVDRRSQYAFLWVFEVMFDFECRIGDAFTYNDRPESVEHVAFATDNAQLLQEVEKVILEFDESIQFLQSNQDISQYTYYYHSIHEGKECKGIYDVFDTILKRKP